MTGKDRGMGGSEDASTSIRPHCHGPPGHTISPPSAIRTQTGAIQTTIAKNGNLAFGTSTGHRRQGYGIVDGSGMKS